MHKVVNGEKVNLTEAEILEVKNRELRAAAEEAAIGYKEKRRAEYPSTDELIVALWEQVVEGDGEALRAVQNKRKFIKAKHPKGE